MFILRYVEYLYKILKIKWSQEYINPLILNINMYVQGPIMRFLPVCGPYTEVHVIRPRGCHHKSSLLFWSHYNRTYKAIPVFALDYLHENIYFLS